jgi:TnpA family transposase
LRFATSIKQGTVTASLMLRKLGSYPRQNTGRCTARAGAHRAHAVHWTGCKAWSCRVQAGLNKGEARNALARAVFFNRLGEIRDRSLSNSATGPAASIW